MGAVYSGSRDEPVFQNRDSSLGLLIASGIFERLVPGSPAVTYLGGQRSTLKHLCSVFESARYSFELIGQSFAIKTGLRRR